MNTFIKSYQLLNEDVGCDLHIYLSNISGYDHIAANGYRSLLNNLIFESVVRLELDEFSIDHILPIAAAAKYFDMFLHIKVPETLQLNISQMFQLWGALRFGAQVRQSMKDAKKICAADMEQSLVYMTEHFMDATLRQMDGKHPKYVMIPFDTTIFSRNDLYFTVRDYLKDKNIELLPVVYEEMTGYDYLSWVYSLDLELNYGTFWFELQREGTLSSTELAAYFKRFGVSAHGDLHFANYVQMRDMLFAGITARFQEQRKYPKNIIKVTRDERFEAFKSFAQASHSLACGAFITPLAALLGRKFYTVAEDTVLIMTCGSILTSKGKDTFGAYIEMYLEKTLQESYEIVAFSVSYDANVMANTISLMEVLDKLHINIQHWKQAATGAEIVVYSPGYAALIQIYHQVVKLFGRNSFYCDDMPEYCPPISQAPKIDYMKAEAVEDPFHYESDIASFDDINPQSIQRAAGRLASISAADMTGVLHDKYYSEELQTNVYMVMENIQQTGSFKIRGASNMLIKAYEQAKAQGRTIEGVIACSAGNHAQGVAKTANLLGIKCTIVCPESAPITKLYATMRYKAEVLKYGKVFDEANYFAIELAKKRHWMFIPPYNSFDVIEGQGTIAHEFYYQMNRAEQPIDTIMVNVGGGGMISGIALYAKKINPKVKIIGVYAERVFPLKKMKETGDLVEVDKTVGTIADGCNVKHPGGIHDEVLKKLVDQYICVSENDIAATIVSVLLRTKTICEGAGVMGLAALLYNKYKADVDENVGIIICGGNIDISRLYGIYKIGLISIGNLLKIKLILANKPGQLTYLVRIINKYAGNLVYVRHTRNEDEITWDSAWVNLEVSMPCLAATLALKEELAAKYEKQKIIFPGSKLIPE